MTNAGDVVIEKGTWYLEAHGYGISNRPMKGIRGQSDISNRGRLSKLFNKLRKYAPEPEYIVTIRLGSLCGGLGPSERASDGTLE